MTEPMDDATSERLAHLFAEFIDAMPEGYEVVIFMLADAGSTWETVVTASLPPSQFHGVVRRWLERYDAGLTEPFRRA